MKIVLDAMGSDQRPAPDVAGAVAAAREFGVTIVLVGPEAPIKTELAKHPTTGLSIEVVNATQAIDMDDPNPAYAVDKQRDSSINVGLRLLKNKEVDGFASAGNTGAISACATLSVLGPGRVKGIKRAGLVAVVPLSSGYVLALDVGATPDCKPEYLAQFAQMGSLYAEKVLGLARPRVALLANGEEDIKGDQLVKDAHKLLKTIQGLHFIGNIEPKDMLKGGADVVVCDGFVGNIMLKTAEGIARFLREAMREEILPNPLYKIAAQVLRPALTRAFMRLDDSEVGGAPLLGVDGVVIIGHGRSDAKAIKNMIGTTMRAVESNVVEAIRQIGQ
jgi:glycerol-3-phosphate acyltransferase PlsX